MPGEDIQISSNSNQSNHDNATQNFESDESGQKTLNGSNVLLNSNSASQETEDSSLVVELPSSQNVNEIENSEVEQSNKSSMMESGDESSVNTLDDISSLKTVEDDTSVITTNDEKGSDIGSIEAQLAPHSFREPEEQVNNESEEPESGWIDVIGSGDLMKRIVRKGDGVHTRPERGQAVTIRIVGRLETDKIVEDEKEKTIIVGDADVIQGVDLAIPLMELHEISEIIIKPRLAYGAIGNEPEIPPHSTIKYEVELLSVGDEPDPEKMSFAERKIIGDQKRERGNFWYSRDECSSALHCYRRALDFLDDNSKNFTEITEEQRELAAMWMTVSNNMAAAQIRLGAFEAALKSVDNVLRVQPKNVKALFRKAKILSKTGKTDEAIPILKNMLELEPDNKTVQAELTALKSRLVTEKKSERDMYRRMLGQDKEAPAIMSSMDDSSRKFLKWGIIIGGLTAVIASIAAYRHFHGANL